MDKQRRHPLVALEANKLGHVEIRHSNNNNAKEHDLNRFAPLMEQVKLVQLTATETKQLYDSVYALAC